MKKRLSDLKVIKTNNIDDITKEFNYPFNKETLKLLKEENLFHQEYYYIKRNNDYAFFVLYKNKMNLLTFSKLKLNYNLNVIGYPLSLSNKGYITNNEEMLFDYIKTIKGAKLILNVEDKKTYKSYLRGHTLPTCIFKNDFKTFEDYLNSLRSSYRRRINNAIKACKNIEIEYNNDTDIYNLYLQTYNKSNYKLEKIEKEFFNKIDAQKIIFKENNIKKGFVLIKEHDKKLTFMLCGMDYKYDTTDLYYYMLLEIIKYAINNNIKLIDFGQTSEETKLKIGCTIEKRYFYANHSNKIMNFIVSKSKDLLEYKYENKTYKVFKESK